MARRVNTKFVISLSLVMGGVVAVAGTAIAGPKLLRMYRDRNPEVILARAESEEKAGDLKKAAADYERAADKMGQAHTVGADKWYLKAAELAQKVSTTATTAEEAVGYYQQTRRLWAAAKRENPRNKELVAMLMELQYTDSEYFPTAAQYVELEKLSDDLIKIAPTDKLAAKAYTYIAKAKYRQALLNTTRTVTMDVIDEIQKKYLDKADELEPGLPLAVALRAEMDWRKQQYKMSQMNIDPREQPSTGATEEAKRTWKEMVEKYQGPEGVGGIAARLQAFLDSHGMNADVAEVMAGMMEEQWEISGRTDKSRLDAIVDLFEKTFKADPTNKEMGQRLAQVHRMLGDPSKGIDALNQIIKQDEKAPEGYWRLAEYHANLQNTQAAIDAYGEVRKRKDQIGSGRQADFNYQYQVLSLENLAWLHMDMAERAGAQTTEGRAHLKLAAGYTDELRKQNIIKSVLQMLDGRAALLNRDIAQATKMLREAEAGLNQPQFRQRYRKVQLLLADANELENQPGMALELVDKALAIPSERGIDFNSLFRKGTLLIRVGRFDEASALMQKLRGKEIIEDGKLTGRFANDEPLKDLLPTIKRIQLTAEAAKNPNQQKTGVVKVLRESGDILEAARIQLLDGDYEGAAADALGMLKGGEKISEQQTAMAYRIVILSYTRLNRKEDAKKTVAEALTKMPKDTSFQQWSARFEQTGDPNSPEVQRAVIDAVSDEYTKQFLYSDFYLSQRNFDEALAAMQKAEKALGDTPDRDRQREAIDRGFNLSLVAAVNSNSAKQQGYYDVAQRYVSQAEKLNLDGSGGRLYQGRMLMVRTGNKEGIKFLEQAVAQRPDYAYSRVVLGEGYLRVGNNGAALDEFRAAVKLAPNNIQALSYAVRLLGERGDSASIEEARTLLRTGLALAPNNRDLLTYQDLLTPTNELSLAIDRRLAIKAREPNDSVNNLRLANLYTRVGDPASRGKAVELVKVEFEKNPTELGLADMLARLYMEQGSANVAEDKARGLAVYEPFLKNEDKSVQYRALILRGEYAKRAELIDVAIATFSDAIKIQAEDSDEAERHLGDMYFELNRWSDAEAVYQKAIAKAKEPAGREALVRRMIETQLRAGTPEKNASALQLLAEFLKANPNDKQGLILRAFAQIKQNNIPAAIADLNTVLAASPNQTEALYYRALANNAQNKFDEAIRDLVAARSVDRGATNIRMLLAQIYMQTQRYGEAALEFAETIDLHPEMEQVRISYAEFLLMLAKMEKDFPKGGGIEFVDNIRQMRLKERLVNLVRESSARFPGKPYWFLVYAQYLTLDGDPRAAHTFYKKLVDDPEARKDPIVQEMYLNSLLATETYENAVKEGGDLLQTNGEFIAGNPQFATLYVKRAKALYKLNKTAEGELDLNRALTIAYNEAKKNGNYGPYLKVLSDATDKTEPAPLEISDVSAVLKNRVAANPDEVIARMGLVQMLMLEGKTSEASQAAKQIQVPASDNVLQSVFLRQRALVASQNKEYDQATKDYQAIIEANPEDVESLNNYAFMLADNLNKPDEAIKFAQRALDVLRTKSNATRVFSAMPGVMDTLGWAQFKKGEVDKSVVTLRSASKIAPLPSIYLHLAMALEKQAINGNGDMVVALNAARDGVNLATAAKDPLLPELQAVQDRLAKQVARP